MSRSVPRLAAMALLGLLLTACGGGNDGPVTPPPTPTASIAIGASSATVQSGATTPVAVTLTRGGGFTGAVTVTATGLPAGVTASNATIAAGATTASITLTAAANAAAATAAAVSITGTAAGVTIAPQNLSLTVTPSAGASIALSAATGSVEAGRSRTVDVTLTRSGTFAGSVVLGATGLPIGVTVASQTIAAGASTATLTISTSSAAAAATTPLNITATGTGVTIAPQVYTLTVTPAPISQIGTDILNSDGQFGSKLALSANGSRVVVGAMWSANGTTRVYQRSGSSWTQVGADIIGEGLEDWSGSSVDINAAGTRIAIGAYLNDGGGTNSGHVRVFDLVGTTWTQVGGDLDGNASGWGLGYSVAISGSGDRLVAGAPTNGGNTGHMKAFELVAGVWTQLGQVITADYEFGDEVDISSDGTTIAVSSPSADGSSRAGTVQVYRLSGATWTQVGNTLQGQAIADVFGSGLSLSANGARIAVAAPGDKEGGQSGGGSAAGKVRVFDLVGGTWTQVGASVLGKTGLNGENLGETLVLSDDGTRFVATGTSQSVAKVYTLVSGAWVQTGSDITGGARSEGVALSANGSTVAVGWVNGAPRLVRVFSITP